MAYQEQLGITDAQSREVMRQSRQAADDCDCQSALLVRVVDGLAFVQRTNWNGDAMPTLKIEVR